MKLNRTAAIVLRSRSAGEIPAVRARMGFSRIVVMDGPPNRDEKDVVSGSTSDRDYGLTEVQLWVQVSVLRQNAHLLLELLRNIGRVRSFFVTDCRTRLSA